MAKGEALLALLAPKKGEEGEGSPDEEKGDSEHEQAVRDFFEAGKKGDYAAASEALETFVLNCTSKYGSEKSDTEE